MLKSLKTLVLIIIGSFFTLSALAQEMKITPVAKPLGYVGYCADKAGCPASKERGAPVDISLLRPALERTASIANRSGTTCNVDRDWSTDKRHRNCSNTLRVYESLLRQGWGNGDILLAIAKRGGIRTLVVLTRNGYVIDGRVWTKNVWVLEVLQNPNAPTQWSRVTS